MELILLRLRDSRSMLRPLQRIHSIYICMNYYPSRHKQLTSTPCLGTFLRIKAEERADELSITGL